MRLLQSRQSTHIKSCSLRAPPPSLPPYPETLSIQSSKSPHPAQAGALQEEHFNSLPTDDVPPKDSSRTRSFRLHRSISAYKATFSLLNAESWKKFRGGGKQPKHNCALQLSQASILLMQVRQNRCPHPSHFLESIADKFVWFGWEQLTLSPSTADATGWTGREISDGNSFGSWSPKSKPLSSSSSESSLSTSSSKPKLQPDTPPPPHLLRSDFCSFLRAVRCFFRATARSLHS
ncbi:hypothetical protein BDR26DRAFT_382054 [Obelidium mucronatum]|nr:hypothetical protein BDR26DRAFT_382054 [Obelidium mucronatum]